MNSLALLKESVDFKPKPKPNKKLI